MVGVNATLMEKFTNLQRPYFVTHPSGVRESIGLFFNPRNIDNDLKLMFIIMDKKTILTNDLKVYRIERYDLPNPKLIATIIH